PGGGGELHQRVLPRPGGGGAHPLPRRCPEDAARSGLRRGEGAGSRHGAPGRRPRGGDGRLGCALFRPGPDGGALHPPSPRRRARHPARAGGRRDGGGAGAAAGVRIMRPVRKPSRPPQHSPSRKGAAAVPAPASEPRGRRLGMLMLWLLVLVAPLLISPTAKEAFRLTKSMASGWLALASLFFFAWEVRKAGTIRWADLWSRPA